jgi:tyrosyl-tRNA synthetase
MGQNPVDVLAERGFVKQVTDEAALRALFDAGPVPVYIGFDPTADSLHAGSLVPLMALMHLERLGHRPIVVLGGGTAMVGDPSGKSELRQMLEGERIAGNLAKIKKQVSRWFDFGGKTIVVDNGEWLLGLRYIDFLRDIGRHFSVNRMLSAESYKIRLERGLSFIELNYQILQAYDFLELYRRHKCLVQMGGDDQWGNILAGVDLVRRLESVKVEALTFPLLTTATGEKMGKTAAGAVWLDAEKLSPFDYYQYWVNCHDQDVGRLLGFFTFLPMSEVREAGKRQNAELNMAKSILAYEATKIVHGAEAARAAHGAAQAAFGGRSLPADLLPSSDVPRSGGASAQEMPSTQLSASELAAGLPLPEVLVRTQMADSKNEARRLITQGAVRFEPGDTVRDVAFSVTRELFAAGPVTLRVGKKKVHRLVLA